MATCASCGVEIMPGSEVLVQGKDRNQKITLCQSCAAKVDATFLAETEEPNLFGAMFFGGVAAVIASAVWYLIVTISNYELGIIAVAVGYIIGQAVFIGAGRKRGLLLQIGSGLITIGSMVVSYYFILRFFLAASLVAEGSTKTLPLLLPLDLIGELFGVLVSESPLSLLFWAIAVWEAFIIPAPRKLRRAK